jgi:molybdopterin synthase catalytic subunit
MTVEVNILEGPVPILPPLEVAGAGALINFSGMVRPTEAGKSIQGLQYEAYRPMAERQIELIARSLMATHGLLAMRIAHSVGWVPVGECSFRLDVAALHRREALLAMGEFIDRLKEDVPIWKQAR